MENFLMDRSFKTLVKMHCYPVLKFADTEIPVLIQCKLLGLIFE